MAIQPRNRIATHEDIRSASNVVMKTKMHKINVLVPRQMHAKMKKKVIDEGTNLTEVFNKFVKEYVDG